MTHVLRNSPQERSAHIDSLRAVAALLVVWIHASELFAPLAGGSMLHDIAQRYDFGRIGVVAFFGVSGLLIPTSLKDDRAFLVRRFFPSFPGLLALDSTRRPDDVESLRPPDLAGRGGPEFHDDP